jgi:hypothetical protein
MNGIVDTGFLVAFANWNDIHRNKRETIPLISPPES